MPNNRRRLVGRVISDKMDKTRVVAVDVARRHRLYDKVVHQTHRYYIHDERKCRQDGRPGAESSKASRISRLKRWALEAVLEKKL